MVTLLTRHSYEPVLLGPIHCYQWITLHNWGTAINEVIPEQRTAIKQLHIPHYAFLDISNNSDDGRADADEGDENGGVDDDGGDDDDVFPREPTPFRMFVTICQSPSLLRSSTWKLMLVRDENCDRR